MENSLRIRKKIFEEELLGKGKNRENWEMLCCSDKPLVPFVGAGLSAWCYPTWSNLLKKIVREQFSPTSAYIVEQALEYREKPRVKNQKEFHWMEEIGECIFKYENGSKGDKSEDSRFELIKGQWGEREQCLDNLRKYVGAESKNTKQKAEEALTRNFDPEKLKEGKKMPEYQHLLHKLFPDILITTNYDKALEQCYPSILRYSYEDLGGKRKKKGRKDTEKEKKGEKHSWLFRAIIAKLEKMKARLDGADLCFSNVTIPDIPMLLKVHGSIEQVDSLALSREGYDSAYSGEMPELLSEIFVRSTVIFMGCSLVEDRILDKLEELKEQGKKICHFAFLSGDENDEAQTVKRLKKYGIHPIFYYENILRRHFADEVEVMGSYHDYFLELLLENLFRRKIYLSQPLELLWDERRFETEDLSTVLKREMAERPLQREPQYIRRRKAYQIKEMLATSDECPLIGVIGEAGSGKSTLCKSIRELQRSHIDRIQIFYISLLNCKNWEDFCIRMYQEMNILMLEIPKQEEWRDFARVIAKNCSVFWRSVLILDHMDQLRDETLSPGLWETIISILKYWKEHQTRVIFISQEYPLGISCYTWQMDKLREEEAIRLFFSFCTLKGTREVSYLEKKSISELFYRQSFQPSSIYLLASYANSKSDLTSLLEEWKLYHENGETGEQTLARILWNNLLDEHRYDGHEPDEQWDIRKNILWIWGILENYPGVFPSVFFEQILEHAKGYQAKKISYKTLMFMKNDGLCEENENKNQTTLLKNMDQCVNLYFLGAQERECISTYNELFEFFDGNGNGTVIEEGRELFRGYVMPDSVGNLKKCILDEYPLENEKTNENPEDSVLAILEEISEKVNSSEKRNREQLLNTVLHYEIKTIIRFHRNLLSKMGNSKERRKRIIRTCYNFSHYYQYYPNHAFPLVSRLLEYLKETDGTWEEKAGIQAELYCVMGDIQRLLGNKEKASENYETSIRVSNEQMIHSLEQGGEFYREELRRMAGTLLVSNYYDNTLQNRKEEMNRAKHIYEGLKDHSGLAYCNQWMGEVSFTELDEEEPEIKKKDQKEKIGKIVGYYNHAAGIFYEENERTGYAYILKCMGDLVVRFKKFFQDEKFYLERTPQSCIELKKNGKTKMLWTDMATVCYLEAFAIYFKYVNWRGMANVLQAMCTCYRNKTDASDKDYMIKTKELYGLAEECYRWLGDIRGLSDTLDYFGHGYRCYMKKRKQQKVSYKEFGYIALSKWMESKDIWNSLGNEKKAGKARDMIQKLRKELE